MAIPTGTQYYVPITAENSLIASSETNFLYQVNLSSKLASDSTFKSYISTGNNIVVYDPTSGLNLPKKVILDLASDLLIIYFNGSTSTATDKTFYICVGTNLNVADSASAFSSAGYSHYWGMNEITDAATAEDYLGVCTLTKSGGTLGGSGMFGNGYTSVSANSYLYNNSCTALSSKTSFTISFLYNCSVTASRHFLYQFIDASNSLRLRLNSTSRLLVYIGNASSTSYGYYDSAIPLNANTYVTVVYNGSGATDADKLKIYINAVELTPLTFGGTISSSSPNLSSAPLEICQNATSPIGNIDEVSINSNNLNANIITSRYNQFFNGSFWTVGNGVSYSEDTGIVPSGQLPKVYAPYNPYLASQGIYQNKYNLRMKNLRSYLGI